MIASATAVGLPKEVGGSGSCSAVPPARGHAIDDALAARLEVRRARNGIDAEDLRRAVLGDVLAAGLAGEIFVAADVVERAERLGLLVAAGVEDDHRNAGVDRGLDRLVLRFGNPVRHRDRRRALAHGGANEVRRVRPEVVVGLRLQVGRGTAVRLHDERSVVEALLDDRPERIVGLAADDEDLGAILRHGAAGRHQRRGRQQSCGNAFHMGHDLSSTRLAVWRDSISRLDIYHPSEMIIGTNSRCTQFCIIVSNDTM